MAHELMLLCLLHRHLQEIKLMSWHPNRKPCVGDKKKKPQNRKGHEGGCPRRADKGSWASIIKMHCFRGWRGGSAAKSALKNLSSIPALAWTAHNWVWFQFQTVQAPFVYAWHTLMQTPINKKQNWNKSLKLHCLHVWDCQILIKRYLLKRKKVAIRESERKTSRELWEDKFLSTL